MDPSAIFYWILIAVFTVALLRLRKIAITPKNGPRVHRATYRRR